MKEFANTVALKEFVREHSLVNKHGIIIFSALVTIQTSKRKLVDAMELRITFEGYDNPGELVIHTDIPYQDYPTTFYAKWQDFRNMSNSCLIIEGIHPLPNIGKYEITIKPNQ